MFLSSTMGIQMGISEDGDGMTMVVVVVTSFRDFLGVFVVQICLKNRVERDSES